MAQMKDSGVAWVHQIPQSWKIVRHKNLFELEKELVGDVWSSTQLLSLSTSGIRKVNFGETTGKVPDTYATYQVVKPGDIVMCLFDLDVSAVFSGYSQYNGMISPAYKVLKCKEAVWAPFYRYWFDYIFDGRKFKYLSKNIRYSLTYDEFASLAVVYPKYEEQQRIASYLDEKCGEIDELVQLQEEMIAELKAYKQSVITEAVTKGLNPNAKMKDSGVEWIGEIPEEWDLVRFKNVATVKANLVHPDDYKDYPQVSPDCIEKGSGKLLGYTTVEKANIISDNHLFYKGQLVYSKIRPTLNKVIIAPFDGLCSADMYPIETTLYIEYLKYQMLSEAFNGQVSLVVQDRVKMPKINQSELGDILVIRPTVLEQRQIAVYLDEKTSEVDELITIKEQKITELKDYKKSLIYECVTGKKEVV